MQLFIKTSVKLSISARSIVFVLCYLSVVYLGDSVETFRLFSTLQQ